MHTAFVGFRKAFDSVNHWRHARGIYPKLISLIKGHCEGNQGRVAAGRGPEC